MCDSAITLFTSTHSKSFVYRNFCHHYYTQPYPFLLYKKSNSIYSIYNKVSKYIVVFTFSYSLQCLVL